MTGNKGFDEILKDFRDNAKLAAEVEFLPGTEAVSSRSGYYSSSPFLETLFDITYNLAAYETRPSVVRPELYFDNSRDRYAYCLGLAEEFEKAHNGPFGQGYYPTPGKLKDLYDHQRNNFDEREGVVLTVPDEFGDDYILAIDAFCERKFKERANAGS